MPSKKWKIKHKSDRESKSALCRRIAVPPCSPISPPPECDFGRGETHNHQPPLFFQLLFFNSFYIFLPKGNQIFKARVCPVHAFAELMHIVSNVLLFQMFFAVYLVRAFYFNRLKIYSGTVFNTVSLPTDLIQYMLCGVTKLQPLGKYLMFNIIFSETGLWINQISQ